MTPRYITMMGKKRSGDRPEFDTDANEDASREMQLDQSFQDWATSRERNDTADYIYPENH